MKIILAIALCLITTLAYAGDYVVYDEDGKITSKHRSADGSRIKQKPRWLQIDRETLDSLDRWHKVHTPFLGKPSIVKLPQAEIDATKATEKEAADKIKQDNKDFKDTLKAKLKGLGLDDKETTYLLSNPLY